MADIDEKHRQPMGRMNYFWQEMEQKFDQFELRITLFIQEFNEKIQGLEKRLAVLEMDVRMGVQTPEIKTSSADWKKRFRAGLVKMMEDFQNLTELLGE